jgi:hypothetical protein
MVSESPRFVPAEFDLYEFGDRSGSASRTGSERRWFSHWDGPIGVPAEEITLGWSDDAGTVVLVCTSGRFYDAADARFRAAHLALGGSELPLPQRPESPAATFQVINRITSAEDSWFNVPAPLDDEPATDPATEAARCEGFSVGYHHLAHGMIFMATAGIDPHHLKLGKVQDWNTYDIDARTGFPLNAQRG